jgi:hypothetical protein
MRPWILGVAVVLAAAGVGVADDKKAEAVVKKAIEANGGADNINKYGASRMTLKGEISIMGMDLELTGDMATAGDKIRMNMAFTVMGTNVTVRQVMTAEKGNRVIKAGDNMMTQAVEKDDLELARIGRRVEKLTPLLDPKQFTIRTADDEDVNGKKAAVVVATPKGLDREFKLCFDKETGLLVKTGHKAKSPDGGGEVYQESYPSEFKTVNGIHVPTKLVINQEGKKFLTLNMSDIEMLEKLDDSEFKIDD